MTNRVLAHTGATYPIVQAPMGWIARTQLASAVSRAGGLGVIETSSGETANCQAEIKKMAALGLPFGVNLPIRFLKDDAMLNFVCASGVKFVTTSAGSPAKFIAPLKGAGITVYHAVPTVDAALKCVDAGIDGLVVEGGEGLPNGSSVMDSTEEATRELVDLNRRGVRTAKVLQEKPPVKGQVLRLPLVDDALRGQLDGVRTALGNAVLRTCKGP
jgi:NAD(P)H-dependent flavin oxidoreductase YrpB (nitropropane dioxygenase family)